MKYMKSRKDVLVVVVCDLMVMILQFWLAISTICSVELIGASGWLDDLGAERLTYFCHHRFVATSSS